VRVPVYLAFVSWPPFIYHYAPPISSKGNKKVCAVRGSGQPRRPATPIHGTTERFVTAAGPPQALRGHRRVPAAPLSSRTRCGIQDAARPLTPLCIRAKSVARNVSAVSTRGGS